MATSQIIVNIVEAIESLKMRSYKKQQNHHVSCFDANLRKTSKESAERLFSKPPTPAQRIAVEMLIKSLNEIRKK